MKMDSSKTLAVIAAILFILLFIGLVLFLIFSPASGFTQGPTGVTGPPGILGPIGSFGPPFTGLFTQQVLATGINSTSLNINLEVYQVSNNIKLFIPETEFPNINGSTDYIRFTLPTDLKPSFSIQDNITTFVNNSSYANGSINIDTNGLATIGYNLNANTWNNSNGNYGFGSKTLVYDI